jgi:putative endonuclease
MIWEIVEKLEQYYQYLRAKKSDSRKKRAERFGRIAESIAVFYLRLKLYKILARRYRNRVGEIDIIAIRHKTIAFVEVKARKGSPLAEVLDFHQRQRIMNAAELFIAGRSLYADHMLRFDLMMIGTTHLPIHITDAWRR